MIKGIIFDKDGTLIELDHVWNKIVRNVLSEMCDRYIIDKNNIEVLMNIIGLEDDHTPSNNSLMASYTNYDIAEKWFELLDIDVAKDEFIQLIIELFKKHSIADDIVFNEISGVAKILKLLKNKGFIIGVVTADDVEVASNSLRVAGLGDYIDFIGGTDGVIKPKPEKDLYLIFANKFGLNSHEVVMVGDSICDMEFAANCGIKSIGVLSGTSSKKDFESKADYVIDSVKDLEKIDFLFH